MTDKTDVLIPYGYVSIPGYNIILNTEYIIALSLRNPEYWDEKTKAPLEKQEVKKYNWLLRLWYKEDTYIVTHTYRYSTKRPALIVDVLNRDNSYVLCYDTVQETIDALGFITNIIGNKVAYSEKF